MSDWTPKVGDRVMVGEHGPYKVHALNDEDSEYVQIVVPTEMPRKFRSVLPEWLTPAPEPEPEKPTAPGALVRDGDGCLRSLNHTVSRGSTWYKVDYRSDAVLSLRWEHLPRPITVILADPAEVEQLRAERDELQRRIDKMKAVVDDAEYIGNVTRRVFHRILQGEE